MKLVLALLPFIVAFGTNPSGKPPAGMVRVEAGELIPFFDTDGQNPVAVGAFYMDRYAVTNAEFAAFVKENPRWSREGVSKLFADDGYLRHWQNLDAAGFEKVERSPVTNVSWHAGNAYCKCQGKRLPTLAEWEYAAGAGIENDTLPLSRVILEWYSKPTPAQIPAIGSTFENEYGLHDMHGLIWEWVYDFNSIVMESDSRSNLAINRDLFCASGSFGAADKEDYASFMRFAFRSSLKAKYTVSNLGFRCVMDIGKPSQLQP